jgi:predicted transcriptional regulator
MPRMTVRLSDATVQQLEHRAHQRDCSLSEVIRDALDQAVTPPSLDACARRIVQSLDTRAAGTAAYLQGMVPDYYSSMTDLLADLTWTGLEAIHRGVDMADDSPPLPERAP